MNLHDLKRLSMILPSDSFDVVIKERNGVQIFFTTTKAIPHRTYLAATVNGIALRVAPLPNCYKEGFRYGANLIKGAQ